MTAAATAVKPNSNMTPFDEVTEEILALYEEAKNWADGEPIKTQEQHDAVDAIFKALHEAGKRLDALRIEEKRPLDEQVKAIQDRYNPFIQDKKGKVDLGKSELNKVLTAWRTEQARIKEAAAERARQEAEEERRKAEEMIRSSAGDLEARERAEEQLELAKDAEKFAKHQDKQASSGLGLRTEYVVGLRDLTEAVRHYWKTHRTDFELLVMSLAEADVRRGVRDIPGINVTEQKRARL